MLKINNVELELDLFDADVMDKFIKELEAFDKKQKNKTTKGLSNGEIIRQECKMVFDFFNNVFGPGTDKKIFGTKTNIRVCIEAFKKVIEYSASADKELSKLLKIK